MHLWLGLSLGVVLALVTLTGCVLSFEEPLLGAMHPEVTGRTIPDNAALGHTLEHILATPEGGKLRGIGVAAYIEACAMAPWSAMRPTHSSMETEMMASRTSSRRWCASWVEAARCWRSWEASPAGLLRRSPWRGQTPLIPS